MNPINTAPPFNIVFIGTPEFAFSCLESLLCSPVCRVCAVITQPDKPAGRGQRLCAPPVKILAQKHNLPVFQPASLKGLVLLSPETKPRLAGDETSQALADFLNTNSVDAFVTCAYGKILPAALINFSPRGMINVHPSLLPRWRGAAPLHRALLAGDRVTGVSLMQVEQGLDTGPVYCSKEIAISADETLGSLHDKLARLGADLLLESLPGILSGQLSPSAQACDGITYAEKWEQSDSEIKWADGAELTLRRIRSCFPLPGARTAYEGESVKIFKAHRAADQNFPPMAPGCIVEVNKAELVIAACPGEYIAIDEMQFPGKSRLAINDLLRGRTFKVGERFGQEG